MLYVPDLIMLMHCFLKSFDRFRINFEKRYVVVLSFYRLMNYTATVKPLYTLS